MDKSPISFSRPSVIILIVCIAGIIFSAGYLLGTIASTNPTAGVPIKTINQSPTLQPISKQKVNAGLNNQNPAFKPYSIEIPIDWKITREDRPSGTDTLIITKGEYSLTIDQATFGDGGAEGKCLYPSDYFITKAQTFTDFIDIQGLSGDFRRSWIGEGASAPVIAYTVCQRTAYNSYESITTYGKIDVVSPNPQRAILMKEIDEMITSIIILTNPQ